MLVGTAPHPDQRFTLLISLAVAFNQIKEVVA
jgi:hypothetical protein